MKNLLLSLFLLAFYTILSFSVFAGNRKIRQLESTPKENSDLYKLSPSQSEGMTHSAPTKKPDLQELATKIQWMDYLYASNHGKKISVVLELSPKEEIEAIHFEMYNGISMENEKKRIPIKDLFKKTFKTPNLYLDNDDFLLDRRISPISFHPLDFNPKDGGTFAIRYKNRYFFKLLSTSKEVVMNLIKDGEKWFLADENRFPIKKMHIQITGARPRVVNKIVADWRTSAQRKLKIRSCKESARALLL